MTILKNTLPIILLALIGCSSNNLKSNDIERLSNSDFKSVKDKALYSQSYVINEKIFHYSTYRIEDTYRYIQVLQEGQEVVAVSELKPEDFPYKPQLAKCTLFPHHPELDVESCFRDFNIKVLSKSNVDWKLDILGINFEEKSKREQELAGTISIATVLSPILVPVAILNAPIFIVDSLSNSKHEEKLSITLLHNDNLSLVLDNLEDKEKSILNNQGSAYIGSGFPTEFPLVAFGFKGKKVQWIWEKPGGVCGDGFMFWGLKCSVGIHDKRHF